MSEAETRAEHIDPALKAAGWGVIEGSRILREDPITPPGTVHANGFETQMIVAFVANAGEPALFVAIHGGSQRFPITQSLRPGLSSSAVLRNSALVQTRGVSDNRGMTSAASVADLFKGRQFDQENTS